MGNWHAPISPIRSSWNITHLLRRGPLTDKKIEDYERRGWYSAAFREARREFLERKRQKALERQGRREGNFIIYPDGRQIYSP